MKVFKRIEFDRFVAIIVLLMVLYCMAKMAIDNIEVANSVEAAIIYDSQFPGPELGGPDEQQERLGKDQDRVRTTDGVTIYP